MYGYFYAQYLFSAVIVLVISSLLPSIGNPTDLESLDTAVEILHRMSDHGNLAAAEFYENLRRVQQALPTDKNASADHDGQTQMSGQSLYSPINPTTGSHALEPNAATFAGFTTEMAFLEPTMQDFLGRSDNEMDLIDPDLLTIEGATGLNAWPTPFWS
ncbi:fungal specific transcription factor domain-containing protein [Aspergillus melleus]|uniref:fungal specific transcription factor domain-containing protein n=1 Tax=Aspergillus melleus TaxID=138277 RepID=UPI001E8DDDD4|nr:uncharacterized protein LDX57_002752 [Aspergillus melleus]KAH8425006.1 hypothetical protein LDX57_002752 [Aspergillus melleus]